MIDAIIQFAVSHRLLFFLMTGILVVAGINCMRRLPIDAVPDVTNVQVQVLTAAPSLAPLEVERQITFPVEVAMSGLPGIEEIRSVSKFGLSAVTIVFEDLGRRRGGLAIATILSCGAFSSVCGSSLATTATMSRVSIPSMIRFGYEPAFSAGVVAEIRVGRGRANTG